MGNVSNMVYGLNLFFLCVWIFGGSMMESKIIAAKVDDNSTYRDIVNWEIEHKL